MAIALDPYIYFKGECKEALEFYKSVFGGELELMTYADMPPSDDMGPMQGIDKNWVMHGKLEGGIVKLMASDTMKASPEAKKIDLSLMGDDSDEAKMREMFEKLSEGGSVFMPLSKMFWGDIYGSVTDKYKVTWAMNITLPK